jgi:hypothetical protein
VTDVHEAVLRGHPVGPPFHRAAFHFHGTAAVAADQVMVMPDAAPAIDGFTVYAAQYVHVTGVG